VRARVVAVLKLMTPPATNVIVLYVVTEYKPEVLRKGALGSGAESKELLVMSTGGICGPVVVPETSKSRLLLLA
jgi:hypothetical protein